MRYCVWVQGCGRRCPGCMAPETWLRDGGRAMTVETLSAEITGTIGIEGVTFLGGEPFDQAGKLARLASSVREQGLSVVAFTGYLLEELRASQDKGVLALLAATDLLIDGPFVQEAFDLSRPWVGSANQRYHFLTERYGAADIKGVANRIEVRISPSGGALINGMGDFDKVKKLI